VVTAALATGEVQQQAHLVGFLAGVAGALGCDVKALGDALDPRLLRLKRLAQAIGSNLDFTRLFNPASWPPSARGEWGHAVLTAATVPALLDALGRLEDALRADDLARAAYILEIPAAYRALPDCWLPPWFLQCVPSIAAAKAVPTLAACALRLHALQRALAPCSLLKVYPA